MCFAHALRYFPSFRLSIWQSNLQVTLYKCGLSNKLYFPLHCPSNPRTITPFTKHSVYKNAVTPWHKNCITLSSHSWSHWAANCVNLCVISSRLRSLSFCWLNILLFLHANYFHRHNKFYLMMRSQSHSTHHDMKTYGWVAV